MRYSRQAGRLLRAPGRIGVAAVAAALVTGAAVAAAAPAAASTATTVNCSAGDSLQTALDTAVAGDTLDVTGTCIGKFMISTNLTIIGPATLEGQGTNGTVLVVAPGITVTLEDLTVQDGVQTSLFLGKGGGIYNNGTLTLDGCSVQDNGVGVGGGIYNNGGTLTLNNSSVQDNAAEYGGGIYNLGTVTLDNSVVQGNTASVGGGIYNNGGTLTVDNSVVQGNDGALAGGGIYNYNGMLTVDNSQVRGNTTDIGTFFEGAGGGIVNLGALTLDNSSVKGNTAISDVGGIFNFVSGGATLTLNDSVVKDNTPDDIVTL